MKKFLAVFAVIALVAFAAPAFAANPFMDVPAGHWAYDAVAQLAARGVVSGYPDGAFKGAQPATRYEVASVVARALAKVDAEKASKQDLEMLKKLVMEFKDELDALGVKVDKIDKRVAVLENNIGGWKITGEFRFDANFASNMDGGTNNYLNQLVGAAGRETQFNKSRLRLHFYKFIDENTTFYGRLRTDGMSAITPRWDRALVDMVLPYDVKFRVGRMNFDWEGDLGLYQGNEWDAMMGDIDVDGFQFTKQWGMVNAQLLVGRNVSWDDRDATTTTSDSEYMLYALKLHADFNEKFRGGVMGYFFDNDEALVGELKQNASVYGVYGGFDFTPAVTFKGVYYWSSLDLATAGLEDSPKAWKAILDVKQDLLKFTALWIEYVQMDNTFLETGAQYNWTETGQVLANKPFNNGTSKYFFVRADQKWNDKWSTFLRYVQADFDTAGIDDTKNWTVGVNYQYTPAVQFRLAYDQIDYGNAVANDNNGKESLIRFRTTVNF